MNRGRGSKRGGTRRPPNLNRRYANLPSSSYFPANRASTSARSATSEVDEEEFAFVHPPASPVVQFSAVPVNRREWQQKGSPNHEVATPKKNGSPSTAGIASLFSPIKLPSFSPASPSFRWLFDSAGNPVEFQPSPSPLKVSDFIVRKRARSEDGGDESDEEEDEVDNILKRMRIVKSSGKRALDTVAIQEQTGETSNTTRDHENDFSAPLSISRADLDIVTSMDTELSAASSTASCSSFSTASTHSTTSSPERSKQTLEAEASAPRARPTERVGEDSTGDDRFQGRNEAAEYANKGPNAARGRQVIHNGPPEIGTSYTSSAQGIPVAQFAPHPYPNPYPHPPLPPRYSVQHDRLQIPYFLLPPQYPVPPLRYPVGYAQPQVPAHLNPYRNPSNGAHRNHPGYVLRHYVRTQPPYLPPQQYRGIPYRHWQTVHPVLATQQSSRPAAQPTQLAIPVPPVQQVAWFINEPASGPPVPTPPQHSRFGVRGFEVKVLDADGRMYIAGRNQRAAGCKIPDYARGSDATDPTPAPVVKAKAKKQKNAAGGTRQGANDSGRG